MPVRATYASSFPVPPSATSAAVTNAASSMVAVSCSVNRRTVLMGCGRQEPPSGAFDGLRILAALDRHSRRRTISFERRIKRLGIHQRCFSERRQRVLCLLVWRTCSVGSR